MSISDIQEATFYLMLYSFAGWVLENSYSWLMDGVFWKEGLLKGPFKPMYGFAPLLLSLTLSWHLHWIYILLMSIIIPTVIEYMSGVLLQYLFRKRWWDYSAQSVNLHGHICLRFSVYWCPLSLACIYGLHPRAISLYTHLAPIWNWLFPIFLLYIIADVVWSSYSWRMMAKEQLTVV
jgi:uncharacterized membrane protein